MNFCNFAKVILARTTKDSNAIAWWEKKNPMKMKITAMKITKSFRIIIAAYQVPFGTKFTTT